MCFFLSVVEIDAENRAQQVTSFSQKENEVTFYTDEGSALQMKVCGNSTLRIWFDPSGKFIRRSASFAVINETIENVNSVQVDEQPNCYEIFTEQMRVRINKNPFSLQIFDKYQKLLFSDYKDSGHFYEGTRKVACKVLRKDEHFFGLGEKTGKLDRRNESYKIWNSDKPCYSVVEDPLYKSIPFFMSNYRYGIFLDNTYKTEFKFGTESKDYYSFEAPDGDFIYYFMFGKDYKEIIRQYISLTGQPIMPPKWALGFSQCRGMLTREDWTMEVAEGFRKRNIPCDVIYQDIGWTNYLQDFEWRHGAYKDPKNMLDKLKSMGFKMVVSQDPVISQENKKQWHEADSLGFLVKDSTTGKSYDMPWPWGGNCGVVDFTLPAVADWWGAYQQKPIDDGISGFWTDMGEPAWSNEEQTERLVMKHHLGMHDEIHNVYGLTWDKVVKEEFEKRNPDRRVFQMTRAAYAGLQRYTFGWTGDSGNGDDVTQGWAQLANQIPVTLSAGLGVIPFNTCDITGYCGAITDYPAMAELFTRWMQFGIFTPLSRSHHEGNNAVEPWLFGAEAERNAKSAIELKYRLIPYIYTYAREAYEKGLPILRPLFMEYPADMETFEVNDAFCFGEELLVAPVVKKGAVSKNVYLPEGTWIDYNDKRSVYEGGQHHVVAAPLSTIPIFVKRGSIIPTMPVMQYIHEQKVYPIYFDVFPADLNGSASFNLYEDDGETLGYQRGEFIKTKVACETKEDRYSIRISSRKGNGYEAPGPRDFVFRFYLNDKPKKVLSQDKSIKKVSSSNLENTVNKGDKKVLWSWDSKTGICSVKLPDSPNGFSFDIIK